MHKSVILPFIQVYAPIALAPTAPKVCLLQIINSSAYNSGISGHRVVIMASSYAQAGPNDVVEKVLRRAEIAKVGFGPTKNTLEDTVY